MPNLLKVMGTHTITVILLLTNTHQYISPSYTCLYSSAPPVTTTKTLPLLSCVVGVSAHIRRNPPPPPPKYTYFFLSLQSTFSHQNVSKISPLVGLMKRFRCVHMFSKIFYSFDVRRRHPPNRGCSTVNRMNDHGYCTVTKKAHHPCRITSRNRINRVARPSGLVGNLHTC